MVAARRRSASSGPLRGLQRHVRRRARSCVQSNLPAMPTIGEGGLIPPISGQSLHNLLTNPVYAGAYAFGRTASKVSVENGRKRVRRGLRRSQAQWDVLLQDQHEGYITWSEFERNQQVIADNATGKGSASARGAVRTGGLLLAGLLRCGPCGRKLYC